MSADRTGRPLVLETKDQDNETDYIGPFAVGPAVDEDYWAYRVRLSDDQAIVAFPKYSTYGVGFAREDYSGNTNLPYTKPAEEIYQHIRGNKGDDAISRKDCIKAITMVQDAVRGGIAAAGTDAGR